MKYWMKSVYKNGKETYKNKCVLKNTCPIMEKIKEIIPIEKNTSILDVGCGSGNFTYQFSLLSDNVLGIDHSEYIFEKNPHKDLMLSDATKMSFKDNSFDVVFCSDTLHHVPEYEKVIEEMVRISKKYVVIMEANPLNPLIAGVGLMRKEERILITNPLTLKKVKKLLREINILFSKHILSFFFTNAFANLPEPILNVFPSVRFVDNKFMPWFFVIGKKKEARK